jgi:hypothetical protein
MATVWSAFYPDCLPELPGAPQPLVDHTLRNVAIDFCTRSKAHRADLAVIDADASVGTYALTLPAGTDLVEIIAARFDGYSLDPKAPEFLERQYDDWQTEVGTPTYHTRQSSDSILIVPAPSADATGAIKVKVALCPSATATGLDDWLFAKFRRVIAAGAKSMLMVQTGRPWANEKLSMTYGAQYESALADATVAANKGLVQSRPRFSGSFC